MEVTVKQLNYIRQLRGKCGMSTGQYDPWKSIAKDMRCSVSAAQRRGTSADASITIERLIALQQKREQKAMENEITLTKDSDGDWVDGEGRIWKPAEEEEPEAQQEDEAPPEGANAAN
jgi:hypothetical protein